MQYVFILIEVIIIIISYVSATKKSKLLAGKYEAIKAFELDNINYQLSDEYKARPLELIATGIFCHRVFLLTALTVSLYTIHVFSRDGVYHGVLLFGIAHFLLWICSWAVNDIENQFRKCMPNLTECDMREYAKDKEHLEIGLSGEIVVPVIGTMLFMVWLSLFG